MHSAVSCLGFEPSPCSRQSVVASLCGHVRRSCSYLFVALFLIFLITVEVVVIILVVLILELVLVEVIEALLELQRLAGEPVDSARDELLLDVLAELVVKLELGLNVGCNIVVFVRWWCCRVEEVEE